LSSDITKIKYVDPVNQLSNQDLFIGDNTTALILHLEENEGESVAQFYRGVITFYEAFIKKQLNKFNFKSKVLQVLSFLDPSKCQLLSQSHFALIEDNIPIVNFDKQQTKLEHREFLIDNEIEGIKEAQEDAVKFWHCVCNLKSPMDELKYKNLATLALQLLAIPASNADSEHVFKSCP